MEEGESGDTASCWNLHIASLLLDVPEMQMNDCSTGRGIEISHGWSFHRKQTLCTTEDISTPETFWPDYLT